MKKFITSFLLCLVAFVGHTEVRADIETTLSQYSEYTETTCSEYSEMEEDTPAFIIEAIRAGIKKVLRAISLKLQRLQKAQLVIQTTVEKIKNAFSESELANIADFLKEKKELFQEYYDRLWEVKSYIDQYGQLKALIESQVELVENYTLIFDTFDDTDFFNEEEINAISNTYLGMLEENLNVITQMVTLLTDGNLQVTDGKRLELLSDASEKVREIRLDFNEFTQQLVGISESRSMINDDIEFIKTLTQ